MIIKQLYIEAFRHIYRLIKYKEYRKYCLLEAKYRKVKRYKEVIIDTGDFKILVPDTASFLAAYKEIFVNDIYKFNINKGNPLIFDLGANIGLSILYMKKLYPSARIVGFEPDPYIFGILKRNIISNKIKDVFLINKAAWISDGSVDFLSDGADGGRILEDSLRGKAIRVETADIKKYMMDEGVDFLKVDIEGAEGKMVEHIKDIIRNIKYIFIEYHSRVELRQDIDIIIATLICNGFRISINTVSANYFPCGMPPNKKPFDMQLNIHAWKDSKAEEDLNDIG